MCIAPKGSSSTDENGAEKRKAGRYGRQGKAQQCHTLEALEVEMCCALHGRVVGAVVRMEVVGRKETGRVVAVRGVWGAEGTAIHDMCRTIESIITGKKRDDGDVCEG